MAFGVEAFSFRVSFIRCPASTSIPFKFDHVCIIRLVLDVVYRFIQIKSFIKV